MILPGLAIAILGGCCGYESWSRAPLRKLETEHFVVLFPEDYGPPEDLAWTVEEIYRDLSREVDQTLDGRVRLSLMRTYEDFLEYLNACHFGKFWAPNGIMWATLSYRRELVLSYWSETGFRHELAHLLLGDGGLPVMNWKSEVMASTLESAAESPSGTVRVEKYLKDLLSVVELDEPSLSPGSWVPALRGIGLHFPDGTSGPWKAFVAYLFLSGEARHHGDVLDRLRAMDRDLTERREIGREFLSFLRAFPRRRDIDFALKHAANHRLVVDLVRLHEKRSKLKWPLEDLVASADPQVRWRVGYALGVLRRAEAIPRLRKALDEEGNEYVRRWLAIALGYAGDRTMVLSLIRLMCRSDDMGVASYANSALVRATGQETESFEDLTVLHVYRFHSSGDAWKEYWREHRDEFPPQREVPWSP